MTKIGELQKGDLVVLKLAKQSQDRSDPGALALAQVLDPNGKEPVIEEYRDLFPNMATDVTDVVILDSTSTSPYIKGRRYRLVHEYSPKAIFPASDPRTTVYLAKIGLKISTEPNKPPQLRRIAPR